MADRTCSLDGCEKPPRCGGLTGMCAMHYHRQYRHGSTELTAQSKDAPRVAKPRRYVNLFAPTHPVAAKGGVAWEHRVVLYDTIGLGPHLCHWCKRPINWHRGSHPDAIFVDHLNGVTDDNRPDNLVASCKGCNSGRGSQERSAALREAGWWSNHDTIATLSVEYRRAPIEPVKG